MGSGARFGLAFLVLLGAGIGFGVWEGRRNSERGQAYTAAEAFYRDRMERKPVADAALARQASELDRQYGEVEDARMTDVELLSDGRFRAKLLVKRKGSWFAEVLSGQLPNRIEEVRRGP